MTETIVKKFNSPLEFLEWATHSESPWTGRLSSRETDSDARDFTGTANYDEAYQLAKFGWKEGLDRLAEQVQVAAKLSPQAPNRRKRFDVAGHSPHTPRAAAGEPFAMATRGKDFKQKPIIKIRTNYGYLGNVDTSRVMRWGAAICSYIQTLEKAGFSTQLDAFNEVSSTGPSISFQFPLKKAGQPLSLSNVVFWWGHPSAQRRISFSGRERLDVERWYSGGYGRTAVITPPEPGVLFLNIDDARDTMEECLKVISQKHRKLLEENPDPALSILKDGPPI